MTNFILIKDARILRSTIKRYQPLNECDLTIYFSASRNKLDREVFKFDTKQERNDVIKLLDSIL